ncbi:hypothetical protein HPB48_022984 [Haemaphysalis longicornis]|uniref:MADF domain-containing protein n=1 Tax=Haemaphysalis longicornis TaxID=44386 RepID=A0A9J6FQD2_HAELO|nr:hypothetical protein HPB48_022984 [Haemaphysalis longicornis]
MDGSSDPPGSKKRKLAWSSAEESRLIELYRQFSLLWDNRLTDYYRKDQRQCALRAIASQMGDKFTVGNVRDKIKTLRDYYVKEKKREESKRKHNFRGYVPRWEHFASLEFLRHCTASSDPRDLRPNVPNLSVGQIQSWCNRGRTECQWSIQINGPIEACRNLALAKCQRAIAERDKIQACFNLDISGISRGLGEAKA